MIRNRANKIFLYFLFNLFFLGFHLTVIGQTEINFTPRTSVYSPTKKTYNIKGDFTIIGNTNIVHENSGGSSSKRKVIAVDLDDDDETQNSSSATLVFQEENNAIHDCSDVVFAGLYWSGRTKVDVPEDRKRQIKFKCPGQSSYVNLEARRNDIQYKGDFNIYVGYIEVTDLVRQHGLGEYWFADMALTEGLGDAGFYGGWGMVVIYRNQDMHSRYITVLDGYSFLTGGNSFTTDFPISGFYTPSAGPIDMKVGLMAGEGDPEINGDVFQIRFSNNNNWLNLSHPGNSFDNFFTSSIQTEDNDRKPNLEDNVGIDICVLDIPNPENTIVINKQDSVTFRCQSSNDGYAIFALVMSVNSYFLLPEGLNMVTQINGQDATNEDLVQPGEIIDFKLEIRNKGTESIDSLKVTIPIPYNTEFIQSTGDIYFSGNHDTQPYFDSDYGEFGAIVWDFGNLPIHENREDLLATINFSIKVSEDCGILESSTCDPFVVIDGFFSGRGANTKVKFDEMKFIRGFLDTGCDLFPIEEPLEVSMDVEEYAVQNCVNWEYGRIINFPYAVQSIPFENVVDYFPPGSKIFNEFPLSENFVEFNTANPFPAENKTYFAIPPGEDCAYKFSIIVDIVTVSEVENLTFCQFENPGEIAIKTSNPVYKPFFFDKPLSEDPLETFIPPTDRPGFAVYYVAEGISKDRYGPKVEFEVRVNPVPEANAGLDQTICLGDSAQIGDISESGNTYSWFSEPPGFSSNSSNPWVSPQTTTKYSVVETITETGCSDTATMQTGIGVFPIPTASFSVSNEVVLMDNPGIQFNNESKDADSYLWNFGDNSGPTDQESPYHIYDTIGNFNVTLVASNKPGCTDSISKKVIVTFTQLNPPTAISPLSNNPENQVFSLDLIGISEDSYNLQIFDRWGDIIFESTSKYEAWDGTMKNGKPAPAGVYVWILSYTDFVGIEREQNGTITLVYQHETAAGKLHLPNAFSPNSPNPEDRVFKIDTTGLVNEHYNLQVYNRWGSLVYESQSIENGWRGEQTNGNPAPSGTYIYRLFYSDIKGIRYKQQGNITLIY